jgi:hypothetical protein
MKRLIAMLSLTVALGAQAAPKQIDGDWRGALAKGALRSVTYLHFGQKDGGWRGTFWSGDPASYAVDGVRVEGGHVHFEVQGVASFDGVLDGDVLAGTFHDQGGDGTFALRREPAWDDTMGAP